MRKLIVLGAGGMATVVSDIARFSGFEIVGYLDDLNLNRHGSDFCSGKILGGFSLLTTLKKDGVECAVSAFGDCSARLRVAKMIRSAGFDLPNLVHPSAIVANDVTIGPGAVLAAGAVVNSGSRIGACVIINTAASVDHDCMINDGAHLAPGVRLAGRVTIGSATWIGIGSIIREDIHVGANSFIGAGSLILKDIPDGVLAYGSPAKVVRTYSPA